MGRRIIPKRIGEMLVERGVVTSKQLEAALQRQEVHGGLLGQILVELGFATEEHVAMALAVQYGLPYVQVTDGMVSPEAASAIPDQVVRRYTLMPLHRVGDVLTVAMADPCNLLAVEDIKILTGCEVQMVVSTPTDIQHAIAKTYGAPQMGHDSHR